MQRMKRTTTIDEAQLMDVTVSRATLARFLHTSRPTISRMEKDGLLHPKGDKYVLHEAVADWKASNNAARLADDATIRQLKIEAMQRKADEDAGRLIPADKAKEWDMVNVGKLAATIKSIPARYTRDLKDRKRLGAMYDEAITEFCDSLGRR